MSAPSAPHPPGSSLQPRNIHFDLDRTAVRHWHGGDPGKTAFFDALSIMFPPGERFFIDSVKQFKDQISDPKLRQDVAGFIAQEHLHTREHVDYNRRLDRLGYRAGHLETKLSRRIKWAQSIFSAKRQLAVTCALEHFTAILANELLSDPAYLAQADPEFKRLWTWHALEETEHKAVAFDVLKSVSGGLAGYLLRIRAMVFVTILFNLRTFNHTVSLLKTDGRALSPRTWISLLNFLFGKPGLLRRPAGAYFSYYRPGFHPWQHDNRDLIARHADTITPKPIG